jgi:hypothetical protein
MSEAQAMSTDETPTASVEDSAASGEGAEGPSKKALKKVGRFVERVRSVREKTHSHQGSPSLSLLSPPTIPATHTHTGWCKPNAPILDPIRSIHVIRWTSMRGVLSPPRHHHQTTNALLRASAAKVLFLAKELLIVPTFTTLAHPLTRSSLTAPRRQQAAAAAEKAAQKAAKVRGLFTSSESSANPPFFQPKWRSQAPARVCDV